MSYSRNDDCYPSDFNACPTTQAFHGRISNCMEKHNFALIESFMTPTLQKISFISLGTVPACLFVTSGLFNAGAVSTGIIGTPVTLSLDCYSFFKKTNKNHASKVRPTQPPRENMDDDFIQLADLPSSKKL